jgi:hypothetical protein
MNFNKVHYPKLFPLNTRKDFRLLLESSLQNLIFLLKLHNNKFKKIQINNA